MSRIRQEPTVHDVVVIGSGAGGGTVTKVLADLGLRVLLLEAGPMLAMSDLKEHVWPYQVPHRGVGPRAEGYFGRSPFTYSATFGGAQLEGEPYTVAPGSDFSWFRSRVLGGRTNHYGRVTLRFSDYDFKPRSRDGLGWDWPIGYEDLAPYYDKAERFIGVTGTAEGIRSAPDGIFQPPAALRAHDVLVQRACAKLGIRAVPGRQAVITRPTNGRPPCHYCGQCGRGCMTASNYASSYVQIFPAMQTGRVQIVANAMARELTTDATGRVRDVNYVDRTDGSEKAVRCRTVVLAASACESARLLLNSKSSRHPQGLANASGTVGRYLMDTVGSSASAFVPALSGMPRYNSDGYGGHIYIPWWLWEGKDLGFPRGYHIEVGGGYGMPGVGSFTGIVNRHEGYGVAMKQAIRDEYGASVGLSGRGEMIPNEQSYCEIDPGVVDRWGIPVLRFHWAWSDHELNQVRHMQQTFRAILESMGGQVRSGQAGAQPAGPARPPISRGGAIIHEVGTVRMGDDPKTSVLNRYCQAHEVKNLFVADGAPFVSNPDKNPTHTIVALAWRTAEYLAEAMRKGDV
ncbi:MAG TPA: GMC family oxidoreductase [Vicinamibacterales bacterium]|nr:GMC family oxidoreductase [Vicinamibacterales bacterium]